MGVNGLNSVDLGKLCRTTLPRSNIPEELEGERRHVQENFGAARSGLLNTLYFQALQVEPSYIFLGFWPVFWLSELHWVSQ